MMRLSSKGTKLDAEQMLRGMVSDLDFSSRIRVSHSIFARDQSALGVKRIQSRKFVTPPLREIDLETIEEDVCGAR